jgi:hypothetical protein
MPERRRRVLAAAAFGAGADLVSLCLLDGEPGGAGRGRSTT